MKEIERIIALEIKLLDPTVRKDSSILMELLAPEFKEVIPSGEIWSREQIIKALVSDEYSISYFASKFQSLEIAEDIVMLTYHLSKGDINSFHSIRSSLWKKSGSQWQMIFHQGTLLAR